MQIVEVVRLAEKKIELEWVKSFKDSAQFMAIPIVVFPRKGYKIRKVFGCSQVKVLNFENWSNGKVSKSAKI